MKIKMKTPDQLTQAELAAVVTQIQEWMYADNGEWNPSKEVGGADTVETVEYWLGQYGLTPIEVYIDIAEAPICKECGYEVGSIDAKNCWYCDPNYDGPTDEQQWSHTESAYDLINASRERDREALRIKRNV
jgi:hypothetical protein